MLTARVPDTWQELQNEVARILSECGFTVSVEHHLPLARGQADIDVYAEENINGRRNLILCECKHWKAAVPQNVAHGFRTVAQDAGANAGYIIGLNGFQTGAYQAIENTNIRLVTWQEFQAEFELTWLQTYFVPTVTDKLDPLFTYTEPFAPAWFGNLTDEEQDGFVALVHQHVPVGILTMMLSRWGRISRGIDIPSFPALPLRSAEEPPIDKDGIPDDILDAAGYRDLLDALLHYGHAAIAEFRVYRETALSRRDGQGA